MKSVTVYYRPTCAFSLGVLSFLTLRGADYRVVNLERHEDEQRRLERLLKTAKLETPTIEVEERLYVAPSMSELKDLLEKWGLPADVAPHEELKELRRESTN